MPADDTPVQVSFVWSGRWIARHDTRQLFEGSGDGHPRSIGARFLQEQSRFFVAAAELEPRDHRLPFRAIERFKRSLVLLEHLLTQSCFEWRLLGRRNVSDVLTSRTARETTQLVSYSIGHGAPQIGLKCPFSTVFERTEILERPYQSILHEIVRVSHLTRIPGEAAAGPPPQPGSVPLQQQFERRRVAGLRPLDKLKRGFGVHRRRWFEMIHAAPTLSIDCPVRFLRTLRLGGVRSYRDRSESVEGASTSGLSVAQFALLSRVIRETVRFQRLSVDDAHDFSQTVYLRLLERNCDVFSKFGGRSSLKTFLTVVVNRMLLDWRNSTYGRWRPSAAALRLGKQTVRLESLIHRDGLSVDEAVQKIQSEGPMQSATDLRRLVEHLPVRSRRSYVTDDAVCEATATFYDPVEEEETRRSLRETRRALREALRRLPRQDRWLIDARFAHGQCVRSVAEHLKIDPKVLYRRYDRILRCLRERLHTASSCRVISGIPATPAPSQRSPDGPVEGINRRPRDPAR